MAQTIKIKRSTVTAVPTSLAQGELAYSTLNGGKLFLGRPGGTSGDIDVIGGKYYVDKVDSIQLSGSGVNTDPDSTITGGLAYNLTTGSITSTLAHADRFTGTPGQFGSATAIPVITVDKEGHVTSLTTASVATALTIQDDQLDTDTIDLLTDTLKLFGGSYITSNITAADTITFSHDSTARTDTTSSESKYSGQNFTVVDSVTTNTEGHVTAINVKTVTLADTLQTVTDAGNITTNDITVANLRVNGGTITGPATITIDPDTAGTGGEVVIAGNLTVTGTTTTVNSNTVSIGDNIIVLNGDETAAPTQNAGIEIERGTSLNVQLRWNETTDRWQVTEDGSAYANIVTDANFELLLTEIDGGTF